MRVRVVLAEDQALVRAGLVTILGTDPMIEVVGEASDGVEALQLVAAHRPEVALLDVRMPRCDGIQATRRIVLEHPETKVLVLTTFGQDEVVFEALRAGAAGFLLKDTRPEDLLAAVHAVAAGESRLDPAVTAVGRRFFGLGDNPRLHLITADARPFLRRTDARYDLIVVDAYRPPYVPFYLATQEFFRLARSRLTPGGAIVLNVAAAPGDHRLAEGVSGTLATEFPLVLTWQALRFNQFVIGLDRAEPKERLVQRLTRGPAQLRPLADLLARDMKIASPSIDPWTDDRAPVEWLTDRMILEFAARGGRFEEHELPTGP